VILLAVQLSLFSEPPVVDISPLLADAHAFIREAARRSGVQLIDVSDWNIEQIEAMCKQFDEEEANREAPRWHYGG